MAESAGAPKDLIGFLDYYFVNKAPFQIPQAGREWLAQFGPWFVVVMLVLSLPAVLLLLGVGSTWPPVGFGGFRWNYFSTNGWGYTNVYWLWLIGVVVPFGVTETWPCELTVRPVAFCGTVRPGDTTLPCTVTTRPCASIWNEPSRV